MSVCTGALAWSDCCCSVAQSCPTLCNPMDCSTPGFPVLHHLPEFTQTHVHWVGDAIQLSHPLWPPFSCPHLSQHQGLFQWVGSSHQVPVLKLLPQHPSFQWVSRLWQCLSTLVLPQVPPRLQQISLLILLPPPPSISDFLNWITVDLQYHVGLRGTAKWLSHIHTYLLSYVLFLYGLSQDAEYSSLSCLLIIHPMYGSRGIC